MEVMTHKSQLYVGKNLRLRLIPEVMNLSSAAQWAELIGLATILGAAIYSW
ncbi:MAG: hypothetical protein HOL72_05565, partial [Euryarchaeota archaeon]|nr:hypothetical protein [Euryarchaeota archaeon]